MILPMLLAMTAPSVAHGKEACPLPATAWGTVPPREDGFERYWIGVGDGKILWSYRPVSEELVLDHMRTVATMDPRRLTILYAGNVDCAELRRIAAAIAREGKCRPDACFVVFEPMPGPFLLPPPPPPPMPPRN